VFIRKQWFNRSFRAKSRSQR